MCDRQRRDEWYQEQLEYAEEVKRRDEFRAHLEIVDKAHNRKLCEQRKALADEHGAQKRKKVREINAVKELRLQEKAERTGSTFKQKHDSSIAFRHKVQQQRQEEQRNRSQLREMRAEAAKQSREDQAQEEAHQRRQKVGF